MEFKLEVTSVEVPQLSEESIIAYRWQLLSLNYTGI